MMSRPIGTGAWSGAEQGNRSGTLPLEPLPG
jgi:hypothetical protein